LSRVGKQVGLTENEANSNVRSVDRQYDRRL